MGLVDVLPFSTDYNVREQVDRLFSREVLGAVLVGKFVGDYTAILATDTLGNNLGYTLGITATIGMFIYWDILERKAQKAKNEMSNKQQTISDYEN